MAAVPVTMSVVSTGSAPYAVAISTAPPILPADGGVYPAIFISLVDALGVPTIALAPTTVLLSSSSPNIGSLVNTTVTIPAGANTVVASFKTTGTAGSTTLTASSTGLKPASYPLSSAVPTGYPYRIVITTVPSSVPVSSGYNGTVVVELEDQAGLPTKAVSSTTVQLGSSNTRLLNVTSSSLTIPTGQISVSGQFVTGLVPGTASIVGTSPGLLEGEYSVGIAGVAALALRLFTLPSVAVTCVAPVPQADCNGLVVVGISDLKGDPVRAPFPITVTLRSSNTTVIGLSLHHVVNPQGLEVTIPKGNLTTLAGFTTTPISGTAEITASAPGFASDFATISTNKPVHLPVQLVFSAGPVSLSADSCNCGYAVASLVDSFGNATINQTGNPISVTLTSAKASVANFTSTRLAKVNVSIPADAGFAYAPVTSTYVSGSTTLTASAQNLLSGQVSIATTPALPSGVIVRSLFTSLPADGGTHPAFEVSLLDAAGHPFVSPTGTQVFLNSTQSGIVQVATPIQIPAGQSAVLVPATTSFVAGGSNVSATVNVSPLGYVGGSVLVNTVTPAPSQLGMYVEPNPSPTAATRPSPEVFIQLQDSNGNPAKARAPTSITVISSNSTFFSKNLTVTIAQGTDYAMLPISPLTFGSATFEATSPGLTPASATLSVLPSSYVSGILASSIAIFINQTSTVTLTVKLDNQGLSGIRVTWNSTSGRLSSANSTTDTAGQASVVVTPTNLGSINVTATFSSALTGLKHSSLALAVISPPPHQTTNQSFTGMLLSFPYYLIFVAIAAVVALVVFIVIRRRGRGGGEEFGEEEAEFAFVPRLIGGGGTWRANL
jgi:hypothetical protein